MHIHINDIGRILSFGVLGRRLGVIAMILDKKLIMHAR